MVELLCRISLRALFAVHEVYLPGRTGYKLYDRFPLQFLRVGVEFVVCLCQGSGHDVQRLSAHGPIARHVARRPSQVRH